MVGHGTLDRGGERLPELTSKDFSANAVVYACGVSNAKGGFSDAKNVEDTSLSQLLQNTKTPIRSGNENY